MDILISNTNNENISRIDRQISFALTFQITIMAIKNMLVDVVPQLYAMNNLVNTMLFAMIGFIYFYVILSNISDTKLNYFFVVVSLFLWCSVLLAFILNPETIQYASGRLMRFFVYSYLSLFMLLQLTTAKYLYYYFNKMVYFMFAGLVLATFFFYLNTTNQVIDKVYGMTYGYYAMIPVVNLISRSFKYNKKTDYIFATFGIISILTYGNRGPLIPIFVLILINIFRIKDTKIKLFLFVIMSVLIGIVFFWGIDSLFIYINNLLSNFGIYSRTIDRFISGTITDDSSRGNIWLVVWNAFLANPLFGLGPLGIEVILEGGTAHSFYLDVLATFGIIISSVIFMGSVLIIWKGFKKSMSSEDTEMLLLFFVMSIPRMAIGGGFWHMDEYWWLIGLCCIQILNNNPKSDLLKMNK